MQSNQMSFKARTLSLKKALMMSAVAGSMLVLSGCVTTGSSMLSGNGSNAAADPRLTQGSDAQFFSRSGYQACAAGAAAGMLGCAITNPSNRTQCMIIAGLGACGVAMGANYYLDQRRSEYANTSERLEAMSADIQEDTRNVIARTETVREVMEEDKARIQRIQTDMEAQQLDQAAAERDLAAIDSNIGILRRELANMRKKADSYQEVAAAERVEASPAEMARVEQDIDVMNQQVLALQQEVDELYNMRSAITLG
ncbi:hypothetical protein P8S55_04710 [Halomonas sp. M1]|uniref:hypothetical protein n=1 Tax=unclassified Halomonas TaxID=2609666 RepID=UPI00023A3871|nr:MULTISPECIES: hypothetical protein [unclassified Halomonas]EHK60305.1 putative lipoprotein [Halomonas sp. GFAJ-1]MDP3535270.1 hypothetical protein [Halomonas sp.]WFE72398.1 hypothetical protein P8S55_04710 [Halomonas sp. M1]